MDILNWLQWVVRRVTETDPERYCDVIRLRRLARQRAIVPVSPPRR